MTAGMIVMSILCPIVGSVNLHLFGLFLARRPLARESLRTEVRMRSILRAVLLPLVLAAGLIVGTPRPAEATVFGCEPGGTTFRYSLWETNIDPCAEHLGDGHYRSYVSAFTYRWDSGASTPVNYRFSDQDLWYYCDDSLLQCKPYDAISNDGFIGVSYAASKGRKIGCPGASNIGAVSIRQVDVRYPDTVLKSYLTIRMATGIQFNSRC
jgi:hypothetical protein